MELQTGTANLLAFILRQLDEPAALGQLERAKHLLADFASASAGAFQRVRPSLSGRTSEGEGGGCRKKGLVTAPVLTTPEPQASELLLDTLLWMALTAAEDVTMSQEVLAVCPPAVLRPSGRFETTSLGEGAPHAKRKRQNAEEARGRERTEGTQAA